jgi:hypothetical protein
MRRGRVYEESDIDLLALTDTGFEEACFDLLLSLGFRNLIWRQGSADRGRDIEGVRFVDHPPVDLFQERWFFECKRYSGGVPPEKLNSKIAWADACRPNHLVILMTSHLTDAGLLWLDQIRPQKSYAIHVVDGKALRRLFAERPDLVARYFVDPEQKLLLDARRNWLVHGIVPEAETLKLLSERLGYRKLSMQESAFLLASAKLRSDEVDDLVDDSGPSYFDGLVPYVMDFANSDSSVLPSNYEVVQCAAGVSAWEIAYPKYVAAQLIIDPHARSRPALYCLVYDGEGEGVEMIVEASSDFDSTIRYFEADAGKLARESFKGPLMAPVEPRIPGVAKSTMTVKVERRSSSQTHRPDASNQADSE